MSDVHVIIPAVGTTDAPACTCNELARLLDSGDQPLVTVIVRSVGRDVLAEALGSVARQSYANLEVVVVNALGGLHPRLESSCGSHPLRLCGRDRPLRRSQAANVGLEEARGAYLIFLDDDDWFLPSHIAALVAALEREPSVDVAYAGVRCVDASGRNERTLDFPFDAARLRAGNYIPIHAALFRRAAIAGGARFDESLDLFEDWDFWLQLARRGPFLHVPQSSACYRPGGASGVGLTADDRLRNAGQAAVIEKWRVVWSGDELNATLEEGRRGDATTLARLDAAALELASERRRVAELEREIDGIRRSWSIRITAPMRWLAARVRGPRRRDVPDWAAAPQSGAPIAPTASAAPVIAVVTEAPLVSVVVPVYNACRTDPAFLREALESVCSQTYRHIELVIVDDGSTDATRDLCAEVMRAQNALPIYYFFKENGGQSSARNLGVERARGAYLSFLDQDDMFYPDKLERVVAALGDGVDLVYTDADTIDADDRILVHGVHRGLGCGWPNPKRSAEDVLFRDVFVMPGVMTVTRAAFERFGGFDESLSGYEDDDFFVRAFLGGTVRYLPESTLRWRIHPEAYSQSSRMVASRLRYWEKLMAQHTAGGTDRRRIHGISRRFFREFVRQAAHQLRHGNPMFRQNLETGKRLVPSLAPLERLVFGHWMSAWCLLAGRSRAVRHLLEDWWRATEAQQR